MTRKKGVRITIVVEDETRERFARQVLQKLGYARHELRVTPYPVGRGSAKDWVTRRFPLEVQAMRTKSYQSLGVLVGTDADRAAVIERRNQLSAALTAYGLEARSDRERIVFWIPKWSIETWFYYLSGETADENRSYKSDLKKSNYPRVADSFVSEYRRFKRAENIDTLPSLVAAYEETKRLDG